MIKKSQEIYALIPARSGSKRVKNKNFKVLRNNKNLLKINIDLALKSKRFDKIYVNSNKDFNHKVQKSVFFFKRSKKLSNKDATLIDVVHDFIKKNNFNNKDIICLMLATSPLKNNYDLNCCLNKFLKNKKKYPVISITRDYNSLDLSLIIKNKFALTINNNIKKFNIVKEKRTKTFHFNDGFIVDTVKNFLSRKSLFSNKNLFYEMSEERGFFIDTKFQMKILENHLLK
tara:strand:- start:1135 stop:1824 length:690 start_codon:yes stop_codon:yes gene_type:complete